MPRRSCREVFQEANVYNTPHYINVDYATGRTLNNWIDSLSASFAGVQVTCGVLCYNIQELRPQYLSGLELYVRTKLNSLSSINPQQEHIRTGG